MVSTSGSFLTLLSFRKVLSSAAASTSLLPPVSTASLRASLELEESLSRGGEGRDSEVRLNRGVESRSWTLGNFPDLRTPGERMLRRTEPRRDAHVRGE